MPCAILRGLSCLLPLSFFAALAPAQFNVLQNGDAETGTLAGWTDPLAAGFNVSTVTVHSGGYAFWPGVTGPAAAASHQ